MQPVKGKTGQLLCLLLGDAVISNGVAGVQTSSAKEKETYNWPKISDQRVSDRSLEGAGEGLAGEGCAAEESLLAASEVIASLISHTNTSVRDELCVDVWGRGENGTLDLPVNIGDDLVSLEDFAERAFEELFKLLL